MKFWDGGVCLIKRVSIGCGIVLIAVVVTFSIVSQLLKSPFKELELAQNKWKGAGISHYLMRVEVVPDSPDSICMWEYEIRDQEIVNRIEEICEIQVEDVESGKLVNAYTHEPLISGMTTATDISDVFQTLRDEIANRRCGPNGCECDGYYHYEINFDPVFGYPRTIQETMQFEGKVIIINMLAKLTKAQYFERICTLSGFSLSEYQIDVTPLP